MKTTVKQLAAGTFLAILLMLGNINAKGTEAKSLTPIIEKTLNVENWMNDETIWDVKTFISYEIVDETEAMLEVECWMNSEENWNLNNTIIDERETGLIVEDWMVSESIWNKEQQKSTSRDLTNKPRCLLII